MLSRNRISLLIAGVISIVALGSLVLFVFATPKLATNVESAQAGQISKTAASQQEQNAKAKLAGTKKVSIQDSPKKNGNSTSVTPSIPSANTPLAAIYPDLKQRADSGDVEAECRLGTELARCAALALAHQRIDKLVSNAASKQPGSIEESALLSQIQQATAELAPLDTVCQNITPEQTSGAWHYVFNAAQTGDVPSILAYAVSPPLDAQNFLSDIDGWQTYHDNAAALLESAANKGNPQAMYYSAWMYANYPMPGGAPLVSRNLVKAAGYAQAAAAYANQNSIAQINKMVHKFQTQMTPDEIIQASQFANSMQSALNLSQPSANSDFINGLTPQPEDCSP